MTIEEAAAALANGENPDTSGWPLADVLAATNLAESMMDHAEEDPPPPTEADSPSPVALKPNDLGDLLLSRYRLIRDYNDQLFWYHDNIWTTITNSKIESLVQSLDPKEHTKASRRREAANFAVNQVHADDSITWNRLKDNEVAFTNGVLDLLTGKLRPHNPSDYLDRCIPHDYQPTTNTASDWLRCLEDWFFADEHFGPKIHALQEFMGYILLPHARYKKACILLGESDTGKSQVANLIQAIVGDRNCCSISVEQMGDPRQMAPIRGKMLNLMTELPESALMADGGFKQLVSTQEPIQIDQKFEPACMYVPTAKHMIATNVLPNIDDKTKATYNRLLIIKFNTVIPISKQDRTLQARLRDEMPAVLNWCLDGARRLVERGGMFTDVPDSIDLLEEHRREQNPVVMYIEDRGLVPGFNERIEFRAFCMDFNEWFVNSGGRKWSPRSIGKALGALGYRRRTFNGKRVVIGIGPKAVN